MELEVAIPSPLYRTFSYSSDKKIARGTRVLVPFGARKLVGVVLGEAEKAALGDFQIKAIDTILDETPVYSDVILNIAQWLSSYYLYPIGEVLRAMLPAGSEVTKLKRYSLSKKGEKALANSDPILSLLFENRTQLNVASLKSKIKRLQSVDKIPARITVKHLIDEGHLRLEKATTVKARAMVRQGTAAPLDLSHADQMARILTTRQADVFRSICEHASGSKPKPVLLHGITGSGKTEVYLQLIAELSRRNEERAGVPPQALVLVPEISLTPQMTRIFEERFPQRIAVVHSGMGDTERWQEMERIRTGEALILIGPRSAVFAPFSNLRLLIVDEEHDNSYKQTTGLTYNGRDVAILRAQLESAAVILGSATPSMESYWNAKEGKYLLCTLPDRVTGSVLPQVEVIEAKPGFTQGIVLSQRKLKLTGQEELNRVPIDGRILTALADNHAAGMQSIVLVNRRGFAYYLFSLNEKKSVSCPHCSISLTLHRASTVLHCHYCDYRTSTDAIIAQYPEDQFVAVGYGSEKVEAYLRAQIASARIERLDSDIAAKRGMLHDTLTKFREGKIDILVGTQILAKGHDFPKVTLLCLLDVDQLLELPDFRAGERTFQLAVQASGRAGRADMPGKVLIQTSRSDHPVVKRAIEQNFEGFAERELELRKMGRYPPFTRLILFEVSSSDSRELSQLSARMEKWLDTMAQRHPDLPKAVRVLGPTVPAIEMIRNRHRRTLLLCSHDRQTLWRLAQQFLQVFGKTTGDIRLKVDVDPQSLM